MEEQLAGVLNNAPYAVAGLAAIGLATVAFLFWCAVRPVVSFFGSSKTLLINTFLIALTVAGSGAVGYGSYGSAGLWQGAGIAAVIAGPLFVAIYWLRKWVKWNYNQNEEYN